MAFVRATKTQAKARIALCGPSGSGKTYTALQFAKGLGTKIAVIDSEHGSASKYVDDVAEFDTEALETFSPETYVQAIEEAVRGGYDVIVIDSLSHAWMGKDGALEQVDKAAARSKSNNSYMAWRDVTPMHDRLVDAILQANAHVIVTMRSKTEYIVEKDKNGKQVPRKIGMAPIQRDGIEYEFDIIGDLDLDHRLVITKSRCSSLADEVVMKPGPDVALKIRAWLSDGVAKPQTKVDMLELALETAVSASQYEEACAAVSIQWAMFKTPEKLRLKAAKEAAGKRLAEAFEASEGEAVA